MNHHATQPVTRPTSARGPAINRAIWLQKSELEALAASARALLTSDFRQQDQEAICERLERLLGESRNLAAELGGG